MLLLAGASWPEHCGLVPAALWSTVKEDAFSAVLGDFEADGTCTCAHLDSALNSGLLQARSPKGMLVVCCWVKRHAKYSIQMLLRPLCMCRHERDAQAAGTPVRLGVCLLEPVLQGSGGMVFIDPPFQRAMIRVSRQRGLPVMLDEVFTGFWRLGASSAAHLLGVQPDIGCYAKLLTGVYALVC